MVRIIMLFLLVAGMAACTNNAQNRSLKTQEKQVDPLSSWNDGDSKTSIISFVRRITDKSSEDYIKPAERIATFDNDGTLWSEQPVYFQLFFAIDRIREIAAEHPEWQKNPVLNAAIEGNMEEVMKGGEKGLMELVMVSHAGMTTEEFQTIVSDWIKTTNHPTKNRPFTTMIYQPMLEVINYLKANDFKVFIVSGGGIEFMRPWTDQVYGIPPEQVIGSSIKVEYEMTDNGPVLNRLPELNFLDDKEGKPVAIHQYIGKRPIMAFGNSDGDLQMLQWSAGGDNSSLQVYVHHTDAEREWAYDRGSHIGGFDKGWDEAIEKGWTVVDMKKDWKTVYPELK